MDTKFHGYFEKFIFEFVFFPYHLSSEFWCRTQEVTQGSNSSIK